jgi:hypothetical protein
VPPGGMTALSQITENRKVEPRKLFEFITI